MPIFDVPDAMALFYKDLEKSGFRRSTRNELDSEWINDDTKIEVQTLHVGGTCEIQWRDGKLHKDRTSGWTRLIRPYGDSKLEFVQWLAKCAQVVGS
jgi:hypothetical protein